MAYALGPPGDLYVASSDTLPLVASAGERRLTPERTGAARESNPEGLVAVSTIAPLPANYPIAAGY